MITVVGLAQGFQPHPLLRYGARSATSIAGVSSRSAALRAQATDEHAGEAGADPSSPIAWKDAKLPTNEDNAGNLLRIRHSTAHVMAMAVQKLFKGTKVSIGPEIEKGFYCALRSQRLTCAATRAHTARGVHQHHHRARPRRHLFQNFLRS